MVGDFGAQPRHVLSAPSPADAERFNRLQDIGHAMGARSGVSVEWAHKAQQHFAGEAGLTGIHAREYSLK